MHWMIEPLRRYADFSGRSPRIEFWMFFLFQTLVVLAFLALYVPILMWNPIGAGGKPQDAQAAAAVIPIILWFLFILAMLVPNAAVIVRRFHDQDMPGVVGGLLYGSMWLINLTGLVILVFMCIDGKPHSNRYGPDPKGRGVGDVFA